jgi:hypothetical protein
MFGVGIISKNRKFLREFAKEDADHESTTPMLLAGLRFSRNK